MLVPRQHSTLLSPTSRRSLLVAAAPNGDKSTQVKPPAQQQPGRREAPDTADSTPVWLQQLQQKWEGLDAPQKGYAVVVGVLAAAALPKVVTLLVLGLERILIGGLLAVEEVLLQVLFKGGALVSELRKRGVAHTMARNPTQQLRAPFLVIVGQLPMRVMKVWSDQWVICSVGASCTPCWHTFTIVCITSLSALW